LIIPYTSEFGSSREKINKLIELLKMEKNHTLKRIMINCENVQSFRRMVDGLSKVIGASDEKG
jgi:mannose/fructose/N-acetylgalactosamine-specific phosphotransferase system component IIB